MQIDLFAVASSAVESSGRPGDLTSSRSDLLLIAIPDLLLYCPSQVGVLLPERHSSVNTTPRLSMPVGTMVESEFPQFVDVCHCRDIVQLHLHGNPVAAFGNAL